MPCLNKFVYISTGQVKNKDKLLKVDGKSLSEDQPESNTVTGKQKCFFPLEKNYKVFFKFGVLYDIRITKISFK